MKSFILTRENKAWRLVPFWAMTLLNQTKRVFKVLIPLFLWFIPIILDKAKFLYHKMTDSEAKIPIINKGKRRKRKTSSDNVGQKKQSTIIERSVISPNWQNFLKNQTKMDKKPKESDKTKKVDEEISAYWKQKRLEKKNITSPSQHLKRLNIDQDSHENNNESVESKAELVKNIKKDEQYKHLIENPSNIEEVIQNNSYWKNKRLQKKNGGVVAPTKTILAANIEKQKKVAGVENTASAAASVNTENSSTKPKTTLTKYVAIDCEMVGIGESMRESMLARVSLVNKFGDCIYDKFVKPREKVTDYRTPVSGIRKEDLQTGEEFEVVQKEVAEIIRNRFLVGHALKKDLEVLFLSHPKRKIRDTSKYKPFRRIAMGSTPSLKRLAKELLGVGIQGGEHSSVEDARATMQLYTQNQTHWEAALLARDRKNN